MSWGRYWNDPGLDHEIWQRVSIYLAANLHKRFSLSAGTRILDYGAGPAYVARELLDDGVELVVVEPNPRLREQALDHFDEVRGVTVMDTDKFWAGDETAFQLVLVNSVLQYLTESEAADLLQGLLTRVADQGCVLVSDICESGQSLRRDLLDILPQYKQWFGYRGVSRYLLREIAALPRRRQSLTRYDRDWFQRVVGQQASLEWIDSPTVCRSRLAVLLRPTAAA